MALPKNQYQAYSIATRTVAKTRQVVMLYDGIIRFLRQAQQAIADKRIEDRFRLLTRASDVIVGLQSGIDFDNGGNVAEALNRFYTNMSIRILSVNFNTKDGKEICQSVIDDLKQMRDVWDHIDRNLTSNDAASTAAAAAALTAASTTAASGNVTISA